MKKIIYICAVLLAPCFMSCDNKDEVGKSDNNILLSNPYDYVGEIHNQGLVEFASLLKKSENKDIQVLATDFSIDFIANKINQRAVVTDQQVLRENLYKTISQTKSILPANILRSDNNDANIKAELENSKLTEFQKSNVEAVYAVLDDENHYNVKERILAIESNVLAADKSLEEKEFVLCAIAIAKYSFDFWTENAELSNTTALRNSIVSDDNNNIDLNEEALVTVEKIVKADMAGAIIGGVRGFVQGGATGLVFGPGGLVLTVAGSAVLGALWGSAVTGGIIGWLW